VIAAEEDLKDIAENWELLDVRVKSERRVKVENVVPKVPSDLKEKPYAFCVLLICPNNT
jgi:hypothetical protein